MSPMIFGLELFTPDNQAQGARWLGVIRLKMREQLIELVASTLRARARSGDGPVMDFPCRSARVQPGQTCEGRNIPLQSTAIVPAGT
jgi:hypothetical protein